MKIAALVQATLLGSCMLAGPALADLMPYDSVPGWEILTDTNLGDGCVALATFVDGSDIRLGVNGLDGGFYLIAMNAGWGGIEDGAIYPLTADIDGTVYEGEATGMFVGDVPTMMMYFETYDYLLDITAGTTLTLTDAAGASVAYDLTGVTDAMASLGQCMQEMAG